MLFGDGESPHLLKWAEALSEHYNLFVVSGRSIAPAFFTFLPNNQYISFNLSIRPTGGNYSILSSLPKLIKLINTWKPHYVNAHYLTSYGFTAALAKTLASHPFKLIQTAWGTDVLVTPFKNMAYKTLTKFAIKRCELLITDAKVVTLKANELHPIETETIAFGLPSLPILDISSKQAFLFFSNRALSSNYRIDSVIKLFYKIQCVYTQARLIIANDGEELENLKYLCSTLKLGSKIQFVGYLSPDEQNEYYHKAYFYFSLPQSDATSVSLLEAMAYGCIPIVSNIDANKEWISDSINGIIEKDELINDIEAAFANHEKIILHNQTIIQTKGIFPDSIRRLVKRINSI